MTVADVRAALAGCPDDMVVCREDTEGLVEVDSVEIQTCPHYDTDGKWRPFNADNRLIAVII